MLTISHDRQLQTVITTYEVTPDACQELLGLLRAACSDFISKQAGFIDSALHVNDAQTRIAAYAQWETREDFQAVLRSEEMQERNRKINDLSKSFAPVLYDVAYCSG